MPKSRPEYWIPKLRRNAERDEANKQKLEELGWRILTVWECQTSDANLLARLLATFLSDDVGHKLSDNLVD